MFFDLQKKTIML